MKKPFTLLIVDDEKQNRTLLTELLQDDYHIILAKMACRRWKKLRHTCPI